MNNSQVSLPELFKGIALFTPGGDLIYCIDPTKQNRWHLHLCAALQEWLGLPEPPHFLVPCYTATVDRWRDPDTEQVRTSAVAYPPVLRYQALLNMIFDLWQFQWSPSPWPEDLCHPMVLATYRQQFPQLWDNHDLILRLESQESDRPIVEEHISPKLRFPATERSPTQGYVLRLFVSGHSRTTELTLQTLHHFLERSLGHPYTLKVIDVSKHPEQAELSQISATPTLVKVWPLPMRRIVGSLDDEAKILQVLGYLRD
ncbi:circadian clock KaiB family protein [Phormidium sp. CCY1219]|uniref:circadian clock KaiB family protein n=1 Tax=Phormidium sp. CCY1219 TaxID=2886104 RepID=UPI002D1F88F3|nr:circadian clock KaiB family protein [Phormidium sp. CCY1219]MEB3830997.1 circadian clock KaiB family protein [Phormidium sp. CCY1219]